MNLFILKLKTKVKIKRYIAYYLKPRKFYPTSLGVKEVGITEFDFDHNSVSCVELRGKNFSPFVTNMTMIFDTREGALKSLDKFADRMRHIENYGGNDLKEYREKQEKKDREIKAYLAEMREEIKKEEEIQKQMKEVE